MTISKASAFSLLVGVSPCFAQLSAISEVTAWTTTAVVDSADSTDGSLTFQNRYSTISNFTAGGFTFGTHDMNTANRAFVRRGTTGYGDPDGAGPLDATTRTSNLNTMSIRASNPGSVDTFAGTDYETAEALLLSRSLQVTVYDTFANVRTPGGAYSDIERIDYAWTGGYTVTGKEIISVFNVDPVGAQDDFRIAIFTGWDSVNNRPTSYSTVGVEVGGGSFSTVKLPLPIKTSGTSAPTDPVTNWRLLEYTAGDDISGTAVNAGNSSHGIGGVAIPLTLSAFGLTIGDTIYGYSLMSTDVVHGGSAANLVNWDNATVFPRGTPNTEVGTADFVAFGGAFLVEIPEPSSFGAVATMGLLGFAMLRRKPSLLRRVA